MRFNSVILSVFIGLTICGASAVAATPVELAIEQSTQAILKKDRVRAIKVLSSALARKELSKTQKEKLKEAMKISSEMFFSDRGQSLYESGRNLYLGSSPEASVKLNEALALENGNSLILWALVKSHLQQSQCDLAEQEFEKIPAELDEKYKIFFGLLAYCKQARPVRYSSEGIDPMTVAFLKGVFAFQGGNKFEAQAEFEKATKLSPDFPETFYWMWKINPRMISKAGRYKRDCTTMKMKLVKKFEEFPQLCHFLSEVTELEELNEP